MRHPNAQIPVQSHCLHYDCNCDAFDGLPVREGTYIPYGSFDVDGFTIIEYRGTDVLARKCWDCEKLVPVEAPRYIVRAMSVMTEHDVEFLNDFGIDDPPVFTNVVVCDGCIRGAVLDQILDEIDT